MLPVSSQTSCDAPKVSVAMIAYKHEKFIAQAIDSVLGQETSYPVELVIGDDYSPDDTRRIVEDYALRFPKVIRTILHGQNVGMHKNFYSVMDACRGEYVAFLEGDDYWVFPGKLHEQIEFMETHPHFSMCGTATQVVRQLPDGSMQPAYVIQPEIRKSEYSLPELIGKYPFHTSTMMLRKTSFTRPAWLDNVFNIDTCCLLLCAEQGPVGYFDHITSHYRLHQTNHWHGRQALDLVKKREITVDALDAHFQGRHKRQLLSCELEDRITITRDLIAKGNYSEADNIFKISRLRYGKIFPWKTVLWGMRIFSLKWIETPWHQFTRTVAIRTRLKKLTGHLKSFA